MHGHQIGDELLKRAAARLQSQLRDDDTLARFGGDEFLVLQTGLDRATDVRQLCTRLCGELQKPQDALQLRLPASIGTVVANDQLETVSDYVRAADMALYEAKPSGRTAYAFSRRSSMGD